MSPGYPRTGQLFNIFYLGKVFAVFIYYFKIMLPYIYIIYNRIEYYMVMDRISDDTIINTFSFLVFIVLNHFYILVYYFSCRFYFSSFVSFPLISFILSVIAPYA